MLALLLTGCDSSGDELGVPVPQPPGTALTDGLVVAPGRHLIGPVFRYPDAASRGVQTRAIAGIDRDPVRVYDEYVAQARRLGIMIRGSGTDLSGLRTCALVFPESTNAPLDSPDASDASRLRCQGAAIRPGADETTVAVEVAWGGRNRHAVISTDTSFPLVIDDAGDERAMTPAHLPRLEDTPLATRPGTPFGTRNNGFDSGYRRFILEPGSRVVAETDTFSLSYIDGDERSVVQAYANQLGSGGSAPEVREEPTSGGDVLVVENGPLGGGAAYLLTDPGGRWLLIETSSD